MLNKIDCDECFCVPRVKIVVVGLAAVFISRDKRKILHEGINWRVTLVWVQSIGPPGGQACRLRFTFSFMSYQKKIIKKLSKIVSNIFEHKEHQIERELVKVNGIWETVAKNDILFFMNFQLIAAFNWEKITMLNNFSSFSLKFEYVGNFISYLSHQFPHLV